MGEVAVVLDAMQSAVQIVLQFVATNVKVMPSGVQVIVPVLLVRDHVGLLVRTHVKVLQKYKA